MAVKPPAKRPERRRLPPKPPSIQLYYAMLIYGGKDPTAVYGFILDLPCRLRWARYYHQELYKFDVLSMPPQEAAEELQLMEELSRTIIPRMIYHEFPTLPRVQESLIPIDPEPGATKVQYVFVLRDNSSTESKTARLLKSDVLGVRLRLGLGEQMPKWYEMYRYVNLCPC